MRWRTQPHVHRWFGDQGDDDALRAYFRGHIDASGGRQGYIAMLDGARFAYVEAYSAREQPTYFANMGVSDDVAGGIDLFIGPEDMLGRGLGILTIEAFLSEVFFADAERSACYVAPEIDNDRSIRVFEKAGFVRVREIQVPGDDAPALVLVKHRPAT